MYQNILGVTIKKRLRITGVDCRLTKLLFQQSTSLTTSYSRLPRKLFTPLSG